MAIGKQPDLTTIRAARTTAESSIFAEINITPLTDVFLVMVIIFMVSALAVQVERNQEKKKVEQKQQRGRAGEEEVGPQDQPAVRARPRRSIRRRRRSCS